MIMLFPVLVAQRIRVKTPRKYHIDIILHAFFFLFPRLFLIIGILRLIGGKKNKAIFKSTIFLRDRHLPGLLYNLSIIREIHYHLFFRAKTLFTTFCDSVKIESPHLFSKPDLNF